MSEEPECLELPPFDACGLFGECVANGTQEECYCSRGWSQSKEMALYFVPEEQLDEGTIICNFNRYIFLTLYTLVALSGLAALWLQIYHVRNWKQLKRLSPFLMGLGLQASLAVYRLVNFDEALFGKDVLFSFLVGNAVFFDWISVTVFTNRYFEYVTNRLNFDRTTSRTVFKKLQITSSYMVWADLFLYQPCWITILTPNQDSLGGTIVRLGFVLLGLRIMYYVWTIRLIFRTLISDMERLVNLSRKSAQNVMLPREQTAAERYISHQLLPRTRKLRKIIISLGIFYGIVLLISASWDYAFVFYNFFIPANFISWGVANFFAIKVNIKKHQNGKTLTTKKETVDSAL